MLGESKARKGPGPKERTMSTPTVWGPRPFDAFDQLFRRSFAPVPTPRPGFVPAAEVVREGDDAVIRLEIPGVDVASDVTIELTDHRLVVRGERRDERGGEGSRVREVRYGSFRRSFTLPAHVAGEDVSASYDAGVLTVRVAGVHAAPETRRIEIAGVTPAATEQEQPEQDRPEQGEQAA
jgi:HSP20 family protein